MKLKDGIIVGLSEGKYGDVSVRVRFKPEDVEHTDKEQLKLLWREGEPVDVTVELSETTAKPKETSFYQTFRMTVIEEFGEKTYQEIKARLGVEHLADLKVKYSDQDIEKKLRDELETYRVVNGYYDR